MFLYLPHSYRRSSFRKIPDADLDPYLKSQLLLKTNKQINKMLHFQLESAWLQLLATHQSTAKGISVLDPTEGCWALARSHLSRAGKLWAGGAVPLIPLTLLPRPYWLTAHVPQAQWGMKAPHWRTAFEFCWMVAGSSPRRCAFRKALFHPCWSESWAEIFILIVFQQLKIISELPTAVILSVKTLIKQSCVISAVLSTQSRKV